MIYSMTGYGAARISNNFGLFTADIKSVNNRFLEVNIKLPKELNKFTILIKKIVEEEIKRGNVDLFIRWDPGKAALPELVIDPHLASKYIKSLQELQKLAKSEQTLSLSEIMNLPGVTKYEYPQITDDAYQKVLTKLTRDAISEIKKSRAVEGEHLRQDLLVRKDNLKALYKMIYDNKKVVNDKIEERIKTKFETWSKRYNIDDKEVKEQASMELMVYLDKSDINEELVRLKSHIKSFEKHFVKNRKDAVGKSLDFLLQEFLREINTIGSKSRDTSVINYVLEMKNEIESIREQVQNLE